MYLSQQARGLSPLVKMLALLLQLAPNIDHEDVIFEPFEKKNEIPIQRKEYRCDIISSFQFPSSPLLLVISLRSNGNLYIQCILLYSRSVWYCTIHFEVKIHDEPFIKLCIITIIGRRNTTPLRVSRVRYRCIMGFGLNRPRNFCWPRGRDPTNRMLAIISFRAMSRIVLSCCT